MSQSLAFEIYYIELWHIFSVLFFIIFNFYIYLHARKNAVLYTYLVVEGLLLIWLVSKILKTVSPNPDIRWFFIVTQYLGNCFLGASFFVFAYTYSKGHLPGKRLLLFTGGISLFFFLCMVTNPLHMLFYSYYDFYKDDFGPLFYAQQIYSYVLLLIGIAYCSKQFFFEYHHKRIQAVVISTAVLIPLAVNVFYILGLYKLFFGFRPLFDITPIACNLSLILFAVAAFRFRFLDTAAIAWRTVFNQIPEGVMLMNKRKTVTDMNRTARMTPEAEEITQAVYHYAETDNPLDFLYITSTSKYFRVQWRAPSGNSRRKGYLLRFVDETPYQKALLSLSENNQALARINHILSKRADAKQALTVYKIRNHVGREVHDILGHSIVLALSVLEVARISLKKDLILARDKLDQAMSIIRNAEGQMDHSLLHHKNEALPNSNGFLFDLDRMVNEIRNAGQNISLTVQGVSKEMPAKVNEAVMRLCQEAVTNAIRHGKAEKIDIILRLFNDHLEIYIMDNGIGCSVIKHGFGLSGMEERIVSNLKGILNYGSLEGGFSVRAEIPLTED